MSTWEAIDGAGRIRRCDYGTGAAAARANAVAFDLGGGDLVLLSPPAGEGAEAAFEALDRLGSVVAIVAPNGFHRAGIPAAEARYPAAPIHADPRAMARIARVCRDRGRVRPLDELAPRLPSDLEIFVPPHLKRPDTMARLATPAGTVWYMTDLVINIERLPAGLLGAIVRLLGYRTGLTVNRFGGRFVIVGDRKACSAWLRAELERRPPVALLTGHGPPIHDPELLRSLPELIARGLA